MDTSFLASHCPKGTSACSTNSTFLGEQIRSQLHVDNVCLCMQTQKYAVGYKNITANDNFFTGHFPERKIMPGDVAICCSNSPIMMGISLSQILMQTWELL